MAVYDITLHAFGTWRADHPRGYTERHEGYQGPDPEEQRRREDNLKQRVVEFDEMMQRILIVGTYDICKRRGWRLHGAGNDKTHFHAAISWKVFVDWQDVRDKLKNLLGAHGEKTRTSRYRLSRQTFIAGSGSSGLFERRRPTSPP